MGLFSFVTGRRQAPALLYGDWFNIDELPEKARAQVGQQADLELARDFQRPSVVNFWNYECLECGDLIPTLRSWWQELEGRGLQVIGVHTPTYEAEGRKENVQSAVLRFGMTYPVLNDNRFENWEAWKATARPQLFLVDAEGRIRKTLKRPSRLPQFESAMRSLVAGENS